MDIKEINTLLGKICIATNTDIFPVQLHRRSGNKLMAQVWFDSSVNPVDFTITIRDTVEYINYQVMGSLHRSNKNTTMNYYSMTINGVPVDTNLPDNKEFKTLQKHIGFIASKYQEDKVVLYKVFDTEKQRDVAVVAKNLVIKALYEGRFNLLYESNRTFIQDIGIELSPVVPGDRTALLAAIEDLLQTVKKHLAEISEGKYAYLTVLA